MPAHGGWQDLVGQTSIAFALQHLQDIELITKLMLRATVDDGGKDNVTIVAICI
jgi:hypothetical protein